MGNAGWPSLAWIALVLVVPLALATPAQLETRIVVTAADAVGLSTRGGYATPVVVADLDGTLVVSNTDPLAQHDILSQALANEEETWCARYAGHHACPLFVSPLVPPLGLDGTVYEASVEGLDNLVPGTAYPFFCSVHHWMSGTLVAI